MKIRVTTKSYEYMGLLKESTHEVEKTASNGHGKVYYYFTSNGREWGLDGAECEIVGEEKKAPIKSDGGSSTYYDIDIPAWLLYTLNERQKEGKCYIKTEELIECGFSSDFDAGNIFKSLVRAWGALNGAGKAGNGVDYECNKIVYSANKLKQRNQRKEQK